MTTETPATAAATAAKAAKAMRKSKPISSSKKKAKSKTETKPRTKFPVEKVQNLWKEGKTIEQIAKVCGRYNDKADDPTASFRGSINSLRAKGLLKIDKRWKQAKAKKAA